MEDANIKSEIIVCNIEECKDGSIEKNRILNIKKHSYNNNYSFSHIIQNLNYLI